MLFSFLAFIWAIHSNLSLRIIGHNSRMGFRPAFVARLPDSSPDFSSTNLAPARLVLEKSGLDSGDPTTIADTKHVK